jgi:hypothetical protein
LSNWIAFIVCVLVECAISRLKVDNHSTVDERLPNGRVGQ